MKFGNRSVETEALNAQLVPTSGYEAFISSLASRHHVTYKQSVGDQLAEQITRLSDDDVKLDHIEKLLIALERAGIVPRNNFVPLHVGYLREKFGVRSV